MQLNIYDNYINLKKELNELDSFVIKFVSILAKFNIKYVIISGYVSILFGRSRSSEDVDIITEVISNDNFKELWKAIYKEFECINTENLEEAHKEFLLKNESLRFSLKNKFIPNMELKFIKNDLDKWSLDKRKKVILNNHTLFISPLELQISFKLFLGTEKDIEDARHLYGLFKDNLDTNTLFLFNKKLKVEDLFDKYLK